eukprot:8559822-Pyramimonas_sp.AAC.1
MESWRSRGRVGGEIVGRPRQRATILLYIFFLRDIVSQQSMFDVVDAASVGYIQACKPGWSGGDSMCSWRGSVLNA